MQITIRHAALLAGTILLTSCGESAPQEADLPYGTMQQMMANEVQPTAEIYWDAVAFQSILNDDGTVTENDIRPETDEDWQKLVDAASRMGELAEAMHSPAYASTRGEDWLDFTQGLIDVSAKAKEAAESRDPDAVFEVGGTMYNVCSACHLAYPAEEGEEAATEAAA